MSQSGPTVLVVIGQTLTEPWLSITREGQFPTWLADADRLGVGVRHSHGNRLSPFAQRLDRWHEWARWHGRGRQIVPWADNLVGRPFRGHVQRVTVGSFVSPEHVGWHQNLPDVYALQRWKVVCSMQTALREPFDYVYFTTASSYVRVGELLRRIGELPASLAYAGTAHVDAISGEPFASGASRVFSRDLVERIVAERRSYANDVMEDVGVGRLARALGASLVPWPSLNIGSIQALSAASDSELLANFHFRLTSGTREQRQDAVLMRRLHERLAALDPRGDGRV